LHYHFVNKRPFHFPATRDILSLPDHRQERTMKATPSPAKRYATLAKALRESGLEVQDDDFELIDAVVSACKHLLNVRGAVGSRSSDEPKEKPRSSKKR
jgi:hypothetical protein